MIKLMAIIHLLGLKMLNSEGNEFQAKTSLAFFVFSPIYTKKRMSNFCKQDTQSHDTKAVQSDCDYS